MVRELDDVTAVPRGQRPVSSLAAAQPLASLSGGSSVFADVSIVQLDDDVDVDNNLLPIDHCSDRVQHATVRYLLFALLVLVFFLLLLLLLVLLLLLFSSFFLACTTRSS